MNKPIKIVATYNNVSNPEQLALYYGAVLGADFFIGTEVFQITGGWRCLADDGRAVDFKS